MANGVLKSGVLMEPRFKKEGGITRVIYETNPYDKATGLLRIVQKFSVVLLTTKGSDTVRPWFGTLFSLLPQMNIGKKSDLDVFVRDQVNDARAQFDILQNEDRSTLSADDYLNNVEILGIEVVNTNNVVVSLRFTSATEQALEYSLSS